MQRLNYLLRVTWVEERLGFKYSQFTSRLHGPAHDVTLPLWSLS